MIGQRYGRRCGHQREETWSYDESDLTARADRKGGLGSDKPPRSAKRKSRTHRLAPAKTRCSWLSLVKLSGSDVKQHPDRCSSRRLAGKYWSRGSSCRKGLLDRLRMRKWVSRDLARSSSAAKVSGSYRLLHSMVGAQRASISFFQGQSAT